MLQLFVTKSLRMKSVILIKLCLVGFTQLSSDILMLSVCPIPFVCIASNSNGTWYCHLAVGITSKLQLLYTQFSWSEMDTWGTVDV